jgi:hypothetical protein
MNERVLRTSHPGSATQRSAVQGQRLCITSRCPDTDVGILYPCTPIDEPSVSSVQSSEPPASKSSSAAMNAGLSSTEMIMPIGEPGKQPQPRLLM